MKYTKILVFAIIAIIGAFAANAYYGMGSGMGYGRGYGMMNFEGNNSYGSNAFHETMEGIVESGTYQDLLDFREENNGFGGPRWVNDEESFDTWKEMHEQMESSGYRPGYMMGGQGRGQGGSGFGRAGGCPMLG